jgi:LacI family transcriptional regulator
MKKPRLTDVAAQAGVSLAAASLALAGKGRLSREVREQVLSAAERLGYRKKTVLPLRATQPIRYVGILHHQDKEYEWNFIRPMLLQIEATLLAHGLLPILIPATVQADVEELYRRITETGVGAVFSIHFHDEELFSRLEKRGVLVILVNNSNLQDRFHSVCVDDFQGAYEGCLYLIRLGHRDILYVEYSRPELPAVVADRFVGFRKALDEHQLPFSEAQRITVRHVAVEELKSRLRPVFRRPRRPTAVFAHDDYIGAYACRALEELGLKVPDEVSLIAPGDVLDYDQPYTPQITTMRINTASMGKLACNLFLDRLRGGIEDVHVLKLKQQLVKRATCARRA